MFPPLYAILDPALIPTAIVPFAENLADAGVRLMQLRDKRGSALKIYEQSRELVSALEPCGVKFIVNDRPDIAAIVEASGVHVGQEDLPPEEARLIVGKGYWVGVSTHNIEQFREASTTSADYIAVGPIFATASKQNPDPVVGLELLREVRKLTVKPIVAIGGITLETAGDVYLAGADSVAVIRDLICARDPAARVKQYLEVAAGARR